MTSDEPAWTHSLKVQLTEREFVAAQRALQRLSYRSPRVIRVWVILWVFYSIFAWWCAGLSFRPLDILSNLAFGLGLTVVVVLFCVILCFLRLPSMARRLWRQSRNT